MNNPIALIALFASIVLVWAAFIALVLRFIQGAQLGEHDPGWSSETPHRDDQTHR